MIQNNNIYQVKDKIIVYLLSLAIAFPTAISFPLVTMADNADEKANQLFAEAERFIKLAKEAEKSSYSEALRYYQSALKNLEEITSKHQASQIAAQLVLGKAKINLKELKEKVIPKLQLKAQAETDPFLCTVLLAKQGGESLGKIAKKFVEMGQLDEALKVADSITYREKSDVLAEIAEKYAEIGEKAKALEVLSQGLEVAKSLKGREVYSGYPEFAYQQDKTAALTKIAEKYVEMGEYDRAFQVVKLGASFREIFRKYVEAGEYDRVLRFAETLNFPKHIVLAEIAGKYVEAGDKEKALEALSQALQEVEPLTQTEKSTALAEIAVKYAEAGEKEKALNILSEALEEVNHLVKDWQRERKIYALIETAGKYAEVGDKEKALTVLFQAAQIFQEAKSEIEDWHEVVVEIAVKYAEIGAYDHALVATSEYRGYGFVSEAFERIAKACVKAGEYEKALQIANSRKSNIILIEVAKKYIELGELGKAIQIANSSLYPGNLWGTRDKKASIRADIMAGIAEKYLELGETEKALKMANSIQVIYYREERSLTDWSIYALGLHPKMEALIKIAGKYAEAGEYDKAFKVIDPVGPEMDKAIAKGVYVSEWYKIRMKNQGLIEIALKIAEEYAGRGGKIDSKEKQVLYKIISTAKIGG